MCGADLSTASAASDRIDGLIPDNHNLNLVPLASTIPDWQHLFVILEKHRALLTEFFRLPPVQIRRNVNCDIPGICVVIDDAQIDHRRQDPQNCIINTCNGNLTVLHHCGHTSLIYEHRVWLFLVQTLHERETVGGPPVAHHKAVEA